MLYQNIEELVDSWNKTLSLMAKLADVPVALVMRLSGNEISVFSRNASPVNPYELGDSEVFEDSGLYCEYVINNNKMLLVEDALSDPDWATNPDVKLNMISYLGMPVVDADDKPFGTVCILDSKPNAYSETTIDLMSSIKHNLELQIKQLNHQRLLDEQLQQQELTTLIRGVAHEVNTPLGVGVTAMSIFDAELAKLETAFHSNQLSKQSLEKALSTMRKSVDLITANIQSAAHKLSDLQDITFSESLDKAKSFSLTELISEELDLLVESIPASNISVRVNSSKTEEDTIFINSLLIHKVLSILFNNTLAHGFSDAINAEIVVDISSCSDAFLIEYRDNGSGIQSSNLEKIFYPFFKEKAGANSSGLGLSIARNIVVQHFNGSIVAKPSDTGAWFSIRLPK